MATSGKAKKTAPRRRDRGERSEQERAVEQALLNMSPERLNSILAQKQAMAGRDGVAKLSDSLRDLDAEGAHELIQALDDAIDQYEGGESGKPLSPNDPAPLKVVGRAHAELEPAIIANSSRRRQTLLHSVKAARSWLVDRFGEDESDRGSAVDDDDDDDTESPPAIA